MNCLSCNFCLIIIVIELRVQIGVVSQDQLHHYTLIVQLINRLIISEVTLQHQLSAGNFIKTEKKILKFSGSLEIFVFFFKKINMRIRTHIYNNNNDSNKKEETMFEVFAQRTMYPC